MTDAWITVREGTPHSAAVTTATGVAIDQQVTVGRTGHIPLCQDHVRQLKFRGSQQRA